MPTLLLAFCLLQGDPRERLLEAVRDSRFREAQEALAGLAVDVEPARAVTALVKALPKARERIEPLLAQAERARQAAIDADAGPGFDLREGAIRERRRELLSDRIAELEGKALEAERVYAAIRNLFAFLSPEAASHVAQEAERTRSSILKWELIEGLRAMGRPDLLAAAAAREQDPVALAAAVRGLADGAAEAYLGHPQWQVRVSALRALERSRPSAGAVVRAMQGADGRFRREAARVLETLTGTGLPADAAVWNDWWKANGRDFLRGSYSPGSFRWPEGARPTLFYDLPVESTRVGFLIDRSRSMREEGRLDSARQELKRLLDALPDGSLVNLMFFGSGQRVLWRGPRVLDDAARREAAAFMDRVGAEGATDLHGALVRALGFVGSPEQGRLREDGLDTLVVLSDGRATWGRVVNDELLAETISRKAAPLGPVIHGVSLGRESAALRLLAERTGGRYRVR